MDFLAPADILIIIASLALLAVILDIARRLKKSRYENLQMSSRHLKKTASDLDNFEEDDFDQSQFPSGGSKIIGSRDVEEAVNPESSRAQYTADNNFGFNTPEQQGFDLEHAGFKSQNNEETIYKTFIDYCNLLNDDPIPEQLKIFFTEEMPELKQHKTISEKIGYLKEQGKNLTTEEFFNLLKIVSLSNSISPRISQKTSNYERLNDIFEYASNSRDDLLPTVFTDGFISLMEDTETY